MDWVEMNTNRMLMLATTAAMIEQFNKNNILLLESMGYEVHVAGNFLEGNPISDERLEAFKVWLKEHRGKWFHIPSTRRPSDLNGNGKAVQKTIELINKYHYDFIHCHTPLGSVIGRVAAHKTHTKIIYTAHGFHFYDGAPLKNWLLYYPVEKYLSKFTDILITINKEDYNRAKEYFHAKKTCYIPGIGIDTEKFAPRISGRERIRAELGLNNQDFMLLSVGELNENKNHISVIRAIKGMNLTYVIVGKGGKKGELEIAARENGVDLRLTGFRNDVADFYNAADLFVLPSIREGLNVSLMEAMASGLGVTCGRIRGNIDLIDDKEVLFSPLNVNEIKCAIAAAIKKKEELGSKNIEKIQSFNIHKIERIILEIYGEITNN